MQKISPRLQLLADLIPQDASIIDVGTDHGYLPIWLLENGKINHAIAADIGAGPLAAAERHAQKAGVSEKLRLVRCDGLSAFCPEDADTIVIAGMGGETIQGILQKTPWISRVHRIFLQPMSKQAKLRAWLVQNAFLLNREFLIREGETIYTVWEVLPGVMRPLRPAELELGVLPRMQQNPLFSVYLEQTYTRLRRAADGISRAADPAAVPDSAHILAALEELEQLRKERAKP